MKKSTELSRLETNLELIKIIEEIAREFPDWRLGQLLTNAGFLEPGFDAFYIESSTTLSHVKAARKKYGI